MLLRSVRPFLVEIRGLCLTPALRGSQSRCLSAVGGSAASADGQQRNSTWNRAGLGIAAGVVASGLGLAWYLRGSGRKDSGEHGGGVQSPLLQLRASGGGKEDKAPTTKVSVRERRYKDFSSIKFKGEPYMTPRDFLESVTLDEPRRELDGM